MSIVEEAGLEKGLTDLEASSQWSPRVISKLEGLIRTGNDLALFRVNPIRYAAAQSMDTSESIDLFLQATKAGLFEMEWAIVCASCANVFKSFRNLEKLDPHFRCDLCSMENSANLDEFIHVMFTISPRIRDIILHHPDQLTLDKLLFEFRYSQDAKGQYDGQTLPELMRDFTLVLRYIEPGEEISLEVEILKGAGGLVVRDLVGFGSIAFFQGLDEPASEQHAGLLLDEKGLSGPGLEFTPVRLELQNGVFVFPMVHPVAPGPLTVTCENVSEQRLPLWAVMYPPLESWGPRQIEFEPFLSAKRLLSTETFRRLFRAEAPGEGEGLSVGDLTYLFTDLKDSTAMYDQVGDATAYNLVRLHFDVLARAVADHGGAVVKTVGDAIMATFVRAVDAVSAARAMMEALEAFNTSMATGLMLKIGIHRGHSIAVALNERLDYFGQNVNIASRTQQLADGGEILVSQDVLDAVGVPELLAGSTLIPVSGIMKGVTEEIPVFRVVNARGAASA